MARVTDISGRTLPTRATRSAMPHVLAVPPARDVAPPGSLEFFVSAGQSVPATATFVPLVDSNTPSGVLSLVTSDNYVGRIDYIIAEAPDIVAYVFPNYLFWGMQFNGNPLDAFGFVAFYQGPPGTGTSLVFPCSIDIPPNTQVSMVGANVGAVPHWIDIYLHGWLWSRSYEEG